MFNYLKQCSQLISIPKSSCYLAYSQAFMLPLSHQDFFSQNFNLLFKPTSFTSNHALTILILFAHENNNNAIILAQLCLGLILAHVFYLLIGYYTNQMLQKLSNKC